MSESNGDLNADPFARQTSKEDEEDYSWLNEAETENNKSTAVEKPAKSEVDKSKLVEKEKSPLETGQYIYFHDF